MKRVRRIKRRVKVLPRSKSKRFMVHPDPGLPHRVEVRISRTRAGMLGELRRIDNVHDADECAGLCRTWNRKFTGRPAIRPGMVVARMYLNAQSLNRRPSEIVSHECGHAAMGWARLRNANLRRMAGEEVMCYALGRLVSQVNRVCFASGAFPE